MARYGRAEEALADIDYQLGRIGRNGENQFHSLLLAEKASILGATSGRGAEAGRLFAEAEGTAQSEGAQAWPLQMEQERRAASENSAIL